MEWKITCPHHGEFCGPAVFWRLHYADSVVLMTMMWSLRCITFNT